MQTKDRLEYQTLTDQYKSEKKLDDLNQFCAQLQTKALA